MRTQPNDPLPTAGHVPPTKHSRAAARIRDLITQNAIKEEKKRRDSHQSLFSLDDLPYTFDDSATAREAVVEKHRQKRSKQQQQPPSAPSSARAAAPPSLLPTTSTAAAGTLRTAMLPREEHLPQYRRSRSFPHESALQKSVEQLVAEMTLMTDPLLKLDIDLPAAAAAASAVSAKSEVSDAVDPAATAAGEKRGRVRRNGFDPSLTLATLIAGGDNKENNGNGYASSLRDGDGGASAVQRLRRLQQQREQRRSLDSVLLATITEELGPQPSVCQDLLAPATEKAKRPAKVRRASFQLDYNIRDLADLTISEYNEITNYVPATKDETDTATAARDKSRAQRRTQQRTSLEKLPCMLAEQEIQARAEERERKRQAVLEKRDQHIRDEEEKRQDVFERRVKRQEEKKTKVEAEKRRQLWETVAAAAHAHAYVASRLAACVAANQAAARRHAAATCIAQWWRRRVRILRAVKERHFQARLKRAKPVLLRLVRRWKRALAASAIARFLVACATAPLRGFSPRFIRKYLQAVRTVQRLVRAFVACHRARVDVLVRMWDRAELAFIRELFAQAQMRRRRGQIAASTVAGSMQRWQVKNGNKKTPMAVAVAAAAQADLKARTDRERVSKWSALEAKIEQWIEDKVDRHLTDTEIASTYALGAEVKVGVANALLKAARRLAVNEYSDAIRERFDEMRIVPKYSTLDAKKLLRGDDRGVLAALERKLDLAKCPAERQKARQSVARKPFLLYKKSLVEAIAKEVRQAHRAAQTECRGRRLAFASDH